MTTMGHSLHLSMELDYVITSPNIESLDKSDASPSMMWKTPNLFEFIANATIKRSIQIFKSFKLIPGSISSLIENDERRKDEEEQQRQNNAWSQQPIPVPCSVIFALKDNEEKLMMSNDGDKRCCHVSLEEQNQVQDSHGGETNDDDDDDDGKHRESYLFSGREEDENDNCLDKLRCLASVANDESLKEEMLTPKYEDDSDDNTMFTVQNDALKNDESRLNSSIKEEESMKITTLEDDADEIESYEGRLWKISCTKGLEQEFAEQIEAKQGIDTVYGQITLGAIYVESETGRAIIKATKNLQNNIKKPMLVDVEEIRTIIDMLRKKRKRICPAVLPSKGNDDEEEEKSTDASTLMVLAAAAVSIEASDVSDEGEESINSEGSTTSLDIGDSIDDHTMCMPMHQEEKQQPRRRRESSFQENYASLFTKQIWDEENAPSPKKKRRRNEKSTNPIIKEEEEEGNESEDDGLSVSSEKEQNCDAKEEEIEKSAAEKEDDEMTPSIDSDSEEDEPEVESEDDEEELMDTKNLSAFDRKWLEQYKELKTYRSKNGHCNVPLREGKLGCWVSHQRRKGKQKMAKNRSVLLDRVGFLWKVGVGQNNFDDASWHIQYKKLVAYRKKHGHCKVPMRNKELGHWVFRQRRNYTTNTMRKDREELLNKIGFIWRLQAEEFFTGDNKYWETQYKKLAAYQRRNGRCNVPSTDSELGIWINNQRGVYARNKMRKDRKVRLDKIGFAWNAGTAINDAKWLVQFKKAKAYKEQHGHFVFSTGNQLGAWVNTQRLLNSKKQIRQDRKALLDGIDFVWKCR